MAAATTVLASAGGGYAASAPVGSNTATLPAIGHDPDDEPRNRRGLAYFLLVLAVLGALALLGVAGKALLDRPPGDQAKVAVPSVIDMPVQTAEAAIRAAGLVPETTQVSSAKEIGIVVDQNPGATELVANGSKVGLSVSAGPDTVELPDLKGFTQDEARASLANVNLKVGTIKEVDDTGLDKGQVFTTSPAAGEDVAVDSLIDLNVSSGKVTVPDVVGKTRNEAADMLGELGLSVKTTYVDSTEPENTVLKQSIKATTKVDDGTTITLTIAQPPPPVQTPTTPPPTATTGPTTPVPTGTATTQAP